MVRIYHFYSFCKEKELERFKQEATSELLLHKDHFYCCLESICIGTGSRGDEECRTETFRRLLH